MLFQSPPRARGSTVLQGHSCRPAGVSPACAGIYLQPSPSPNPQHRLPRVRGDLPAIQALSRQYTASPPRARGSTCRARSSQAPSSVSPACAGIYLLLGMSPGEVLESPPRARGSTLDRLHGWVVVLVSPACAGIYLGYQQHIPRLDGLPRVRGDLPFGLRHPVLEAMSPPRARGSTYMTNSVRPKRFVSPACAGIYPAARCWTGAAMRLPRVRGDLPYNSVK